MQWRSAVDYHADKASGKVLIAVRLVRQESWVETNDPVRSARVQRPSPV